MKPVGRGGGWAFGDELRRRRGTTRTTKEVRCHSNEGDSQAIL